MITGKDIEFRTYNFGELCGSISKTELTDKQKTELKGLLEKIQLTEKQAETRDQLIKKRDSNPELDESGKKLVQKIFREEVRKTTDFKVSTKYTEKGLLLENSAIERIARVNGWGICINANKLGIELKDHIGYGHPDVWKEKSKLGFDAKCSFTDETFPLHLKELKEKNYIWQAKRLAMMAQIDRWYICYSLENTPEHIIYKEALKHWYDSENEGQMTSSFLDEVRQMHNFDHLADWERVKTFEVKLTSDDIKIANERAQLGRDYFDLLLENYKSMKNKSLNDL